MDDTAEHQQQQRKYRFGEFVVDVGRGALLQNDQEVRIRAQSYRVLLFLLERRGQLVSKEELHREIWMNKIVSDDSLTHCLLDIRKAIGDSDRTTIRTVPRRGYIFAADCVVEDASPMNSDIVGNIYGNRLASVAALGVVVAVSIVVTWLLMTRNPAPPILIYSNSVAVLPFEDASPAQDQRFLSDGLSSEILSMLSHSPDLRVIARSSAFAVAGQVDDLAGIRNALQVAYVLRGSVQRDEQRIVVDSQLIETSDNGRVWAKRYEGRLEDLIDIQFDIAQNVLVVIAPNADDSVVNPARRNFSADELMLLARFNEQELLEQPEVDEELLARTIQLYKDATRADPESALAYSRLAGALLYAGAIDAAKSPVHRAAALDPDLSEVQATLGEYYWLSGQPGAGAAWQRAIDLNPNNVDALSAYAYWYWMQGHSDGPEELFRRALELDPLSLGRHAALGEFLAHEARVEQADKMIERIQHRFDSAAAYRVIARMYEVTGRIDRAVAFTIMARNLEPDNADHASALAELYAELGDFATAEMMAADDDIGLQFKMRRYRQFIDQAELRVVDQPNDIQLRYLLAYAYNVQSNPEGAIRLLRSIGQPLTVKRENRQALEVEAFVVYIDALDATGNTARARELAEWFYNWQHTTSANWWVHVKLACALAVLGRDDEALSRLERVVDSPRLIWDSTLKDMRCLQRYRDSDRYQAVLRAIDERRNRLLKQLPETLTAFGVSG